MEPLIEKVRVREVIYNVKSPEYRDQHIRQTAWEEIANELNISANEAKESWDKLRRCFCNARNRRRSYKSSAYKKKHFWRYEQQMMFLTPFVESRKTYSNFNKAKVSVLPTKPEDIPAEATDLEESALIEMKEEPTNWDGEKEQSDGYNSVGEGMTIGIDYETLEAKLQTSIDPPANQIVKILEENADVRKCKLEEKTVPSAMNSLETMDATDMFFLSMSRMTKKLPKVDQAQIKLALSNSVLTAEIRNQQ